ncbi:hypothetical protein BJY00DRAFT_41741 [Aspergillus carlsbadensis]|nr:hypothetical protein BJY00DRAFT_41741 [Aspergillus carlsbadensis]
MRDPAAPLRSFLDPRQGAAAFFFEVTCFSTESAASWLPNGRFSRALEALRRKSSWTLSVPGRTILQKLLLARSVPKFVTYGYLSLNLEPRTLWPPNSNHLMGEQAVDSGFVRSAQATHSSLAGVTVRASDSLDSSRSWCLKSVRPLTRAWKFTRDRWILICTPVSSRPLARHAGLDRHVIINTSEEVPLSTFCFCRVLEANAAGIL